MPLKLFLQHDFSKHKSVRKMLMEEEMKQWRWRCQQNLEARKFVEWHWKQQDWLKNLWGTRQVSCPSYPQRESCSSPTLAKLSVEVRYLSRDRRIKSQSTCQCETVSAVFPNWVPERWKPGLYASGWGLKGISRGMSTAQGRRKEYTDAASQHFPNKMARSPPDIQENSRRISNLSFLHIQKALPSCLGLNF